MAPSKPKSGPSSAFWDKQSTVTTRVFSDPFKQDDPDANANASARPVKIEKRRKSSFNSSSSPYARRRSFLSKSMLENDTFQTYELSSYEYFSSLGSSASSSRIPSFSINLSESQGFIWNQDLFASSYQQARAGLKPGSFQSDAGPVEVIDINVENDDDDDDKDNNEKDESLLYEMELS